MDALLHVEDENGRKLNDEEIIDVLLMYLNAGHESSGHIIMWATVFLQKNPEIFAKAKVLICVYIVFFPEFGGRVESRSLIMKFDGNVGRARGCSEEQTP